MHEAELTLFLTFKQHCDSEFLTFKYHNDNEFLIEHTPVIYSSLFTWELKKKMASQLRGVDNQSGVVCLTNGNDSDSMTYDREIYSEIQSLGLFQKAPCALHYIFTFLLYLVSQLISIYLKAMKYSKVGVKHQSN